MADPKRIIRTKAAQARSAAKEEVGRRATSTQYSHRKEIIEDTTQAETLGTSKFPPGVEPAFVRVSVGSTYNLGNFESLRLDVSVTLPCLVEEVEDTYSRASEFCAEKLQEEEAQWLPGASKSGGKSAKK
jgi:hypothetical protein